MRITGRDWGFIAAIGVLLFVLLVNIGKERPKKIPADKRHRALVEGVGKGVSREEVERVCVTCHKAGAVPLPSKHPPKEQCLLCHRED